MSVGYDTACGLMIHRTVGTSTVYKIITAHRDAQRGGPTSSDAARQHANGELYDRGGDGILMSCAENTTRKVDRGVLDYRPAKAGHAKVEEGRHMDGGIGETEEPGMTSDK